MTAEQKRPFEEEAAQHNVATSAAQSHSLEPPPPRHAFVKGDRKFKIHPSLMFLTILNTFESFDPSMCSLCSAA